MSLAEVLAAALVLACASSGSLRIWAASTAAAATLEQRGGRLLALDQALLEVEAELRTAAPAEPGPDCEEAARELAGRLALLPLPAGVGRQLQPAPGGLWLRLQNGELPVRERWLDAAALGACAPATPTTMQEEGDVTPDLSL